MSQTPCTAPAILTSIRAVWVAFNPGLLTHLCCLYALVNWVSIDSGNGLLPFWQQAITWTNAGLLSIGPLGTNFSEILSEIQKFWFTKKHLKMSSMKKQPFFPVEDVLKKNGRNSHRSYDPTMHCSLS